MIAALLLVCWLIVIFVFSAQPAGESKELSDGICYKLAVVLNRIFGFGYGAKELGALSVRLSFPIRKAAHMTEYAVLALLFYWNICLLEWHIKRKQIFIAAWLGTIICAAVDEFHQLFVQGRCGTPKDVCIDAAGALMGLLLYYILVRKRRTNGSGKE